MKRVVFVHVGKTGGTSTTAYLKKADSTWIYNPTVHLTAALIKQDLGAKSFDEALKFSIVRHPVDRYISACRQCSVDANDPVVWDRIKKGGHPHKHSEVEYHIFVTQVESTFIDGQQSCKIFKFEDDLPHNVHNWLKENGLDHGEFPYKLPEQPGAESKQDLTIEALEFVKDFYAEDFEVFGYEP